MVTKETLLQSGNSGWGMGSFHYGECKVITGPRGGKTYKVEHWRANGRLQTWKKQPEKFRLPIKYGMRDYSEINEHNAADFHFAGDCPIEELRYR